MSLNANHIFQGSLFHFVSTLEQIRLISTSLQDIIYTLATLLSTFRLQQRNTTAGAAQQYESMNPSRLVSAVQVVVGGEMVKHDNCTRMASTVTVS